MLSGILKQAVSVFLFHRRQFVQAFAHLHSSVTRSPFSNASFIVFSSIFI